MTPSQDQQHIQRMIIHYRSHSSEQRSTSRYHYRLFWYQYSIGIFFGLGNGSFVNHTTIPTNSSRPIWMHIVHLDNDMFLDLVTGDYGTDSITIFSGDGTGNLSYRMRYSTGYDSSPVSVTIGYLNDDHFLDMSVGNCGSNSIGI